MDADVFKVLGYYNSNEIDPNKENFHGINFPQNNQQQLMYNELALLLMLIISEMDIMMMFKINYTLTVNGKSEQNEHEEKFLTE